MVRILNLLIEIGWACFWCFVVGLLLGGWMGLEGKGGGGGVR